MKYQVNLLPRELQAKPPPTGKKILLLVAVTILIGGLLAGYTALLIDYQAKKQLGQTLQQQLHTAQLVEQKIKEITAERSRVEQIASAQREILAKDHNWFIILEHVNRCVPPQATLTNISLIAPKQEEESPQTSPVISLQGSSPDLTTIGLLLDNLEQLACFKQLSLSWASESVLATEVPVLTFQITAQIAGDDDE